MIGRQLEDSETLPESWGVVSVGEIGTYLNGFAFKPSDWTSEGTPIIRIQNLTDSNKPFNYFDGKIPEEYRIKNGDILVSWSASLGTFLWKRGDAWLNQHIFKATPNLSVINKDYFYWAMFHAIERIADNARGSTMKHVTGKEFKNSEVALPPLPEQKKIAHILSTVQRAIEAQEQIIQTTTELKKALMHKLFTEGTRGEPQKETEIGLVPESWDVLPLGDLLTTAQYGMSVKGDSEGNYPILRMTNQVDGRIVASKLQFVEIGEAEFAKFKVERGDILFNRTNSLDLVGRTAIHNIDGDYIFASYLIRVRTDSERLNPFFLNLDFNRDETQMCLKSIATRAVSQSNISATRLKGFPILLPRLADQEEILACVSPFDTKIALHKTNLATLQELFRTLLHQLMTAKIRVVDFDLLKP